MEFFRDGFPFYQWPSNVEGTRRDQAYSPNIRFFQEIGASPELDVPVRQTGRNSAPDHKRIMENTCTPSLGRTTRTENREAEREREEATPSTSLGEFYRLTTSSLDTSVREKQGGLLARLS